MNTNHIPKAQYFIDDLESPFLSYELFAEEETREVEFGMGTITSPYLGELIFEREAEAEVAEASFEEQERESNLLSPNQVEKAIKNNPIYARQLGWKDHIDELLVLLYDPNPPNQTLTNDSEEFAQLVAHWQAKNAVYPIDGTLGYETWYKAREAIKVKRTSFAKLPNGVFTPGQVNEALGTNSKYCNNNQLSLNAQPNQREDHSSTGYALKDDISKVSLVHEEEGFGDDVGLDYLDDKPYAMLGSDQDFNDIDGESEEGLYDENNHHIEEEQDRRLYSDGFTELSSPNEIDLAHIDDERYNSPVSYHYWRDMENESEEAGDDRTDGELEEEQDGRVFSDDLHKFSPSADHTVAIPAFKQGIRDAMSSLLSPNDLKKATQANQKRHPQMSGVSPSDITTDLARYVNFEIISKTIGKAIKSDEVFAEAVHQFQLKCYSDPKQHDGIAGPSTLDSLGIINQQDRRSISFDPQAKAILTRIKIDKLTNGVYTIDNWFNYIINPSFLGWTFTQGGVHILLVRQLREAERWLASKYGSITPVQLWDQLHGREGETHLGLRQGTSMHSFGLALDILYQRNPWVTAVNYVMDAATGKKYHDTSARDTFNKVLSSAVDSKANSIGYKTPVWTYIKNLESDSTQEAHRKLSWLNSAFVSYVREHLPSDEELRLPGSVFQKGDDRMRDPKKKKKEDVRDPKKGFLYLNQDLVIALRDKAHLAWGAIDFGPASGDMMHFDMRPYGVGRKIAQAIGGYVGKETGSSSPSSNQFDLDYAIERNRYWRKTLGWQLSFEDIIKLLGFRPSTTPSEQALVEAVVRWQSQYHISPADGIIGKKTWGIMQDALYRTSSTEKDPWE